MLKQIACLRHFSSKKLVKGTDIIRNSPSIMLSQQQPASQGINQLTAEQKKKLGLWIVKPPFNHRLSAQKQVQYLPTLTTSLYERQSEQLDPKIRILEQPKQQGPVDMLKYTNLIYKDIYARYLVARGVGVKWDGAYSDHGIMNPERSRTMSDVYTTYLKVYDQIYLKKVPALYSITKGVQVPVESATIETLKLIGESLLMEIVEFGNYDKEFKVLTDKGGKIYFITFVSEFWHLTEMRAICVKGGQAYIILKKDNSQNYHVTSAQHYKTQRDWFTRNGYSKHIIVTGKEFQGMKVKALDGSKVPVILQLEQYDRLYGSRVYPVIPAHNLADYQRGVEYKLSIASQITRQGFIDRPQYQQLNVENPQTSDIIKKRLRDSGMMLELSDLCEDEVFMSPQKDILKLIPVEKLFLSVGQKLKNQFLEKMNQHTVISQSKIKIPKMKQELHGKHRRRFRKIIQKLLEQRTQYYTLDQSLKFGEICISTLGDTDFPVPIFQRRNKIVMPNKIREQISQITQKRPLTMTDLQSLKEPLCKTKTFYLSKQFIRACYFLGSDPASLDRVIIQPQLITQSLLPYALSLSAITSQPPPKLIKLHPTLKLYQNMSTTDMIMGVVKLNEERQHGYGFDALRMWVALRDSEKGDRLINQSELNQQLTNAQTVRKLYWKIISYLKDVDQRKLDQLNKLPVPFFDKFMHDQIDFFIQNMESAYNKMHLTTAHRLTLDFYKNTVYQIYIKSITKKLIAYPKKYLPRLLVFKRVLQCLPVTSPLLPFSCMHVSQTQYMRWPSIRDPSISNYAVDFYNQIINFRTDLRNRLVTNRMNNCLVYIQNLKTPIPEEEMALILNVDEVTYKEPKGVPLRFKETERFEAMIYDYYATCFRCDPKSGNKEYLCQTCQKYMADYSIKLVKL